MKYYIYMYLDQENIPFYIGKGTKKRYLICHHRRDQNPFLAAKIKKISSSNVKIHFLHKDLTEKNAFFWEKYWIKRIGRRDKKEGTLCNLTDGGEGQSGYTHTESTKQKIGQSMKGKLVGIKNPFYGKTGKDRFGYGFPSFGMLGKTHSENTKRKISKAKKGVKLPLFSASHRQKMSLAKKLYWESKRRKVIKEL